MQGVLTMNVLVGCEYSARVSSAFRRRGHNAYSCDNEQDTEGDKRYHLKMDVTNALEVDARPWMWGFVIASLLYSAPTLADWCGDTCGDTWCKGKVKAWGFVVILEGVMVFSSIAWAGYLCLALLMVINCHSAWLLAGKKASR